MKQNPINLPAPVQNQVNKKRLLLVSTRVFWPADTGHKVALSNFCNILANDFLYDIYVFSFLESGQEPNSEQIPGFIKGIEFAQDASLPSKAKGIICAIGDNKRPFQCFAFTGQKNISSLKEYAEMVNPDVVWIDMIRLAPLVFKADLGKRTILYLEDMLSKRYERQRRFTQSDAGILGKYAEKAKGLAALTKNRAVRNLVLWTESMRVANAEKYYAMRCDAVVFVSPLEAAEFQAMCPNVSAIAAPMGVDHEFFSEELDVNRQDHYMTFIGDMQTSANSDTLLYIADNVLPRLPEFKLGVIGNCPPAVSNRFSSNNQLIFLGRVDDLRIEAKKGVVFLAPIAYGSGIKTKILEAMAMGIPIVTNSVGVEGLGVQDGVHCLIRETPNEQAASVRLLASNSKIADFISNNAQEYVRQNHRWSNCRSAFESIGL